MTLWSSEVGPYLWHEFDAVRTERELQRIAASGHAAVRTLLPWDAFMPTPRGVDDRRLRAFESFLAIAERQSLAVVPVLFAQSLGGCIMLPAFAIDVSRKRPGVRVLTDAVVQPGGPRDQYTAQLMIEAALLWLEAMLDGFAGHQAILAWDLGHNPAATMRPRRIEHLAGWTAVIAGRVHESSQRCALTLSTDDITTGRGVRLSGVAEHVDLLMLDAAVGQRLTFLTQLGMRLAGAEARLGVHLAPAAEPAAGVAAAVEDLAAVGCAATYAALWAEPGPRVQAAPPFDHAPELGRAGVVDTAGEPTGFGREWLEAVATERERVASQPWPATLDVTSYYANLPESCADLYAEWQRGGSGRPAIFG